MKSHRVGLILCFVCLAMFPGCSNQTQLGGKVTFSDDGSPLTAGTVNFVNGTFQSRAPLKADGTYTVGTYKADDGLPPGKYKVFITGAVKQVGTTQADASGMGEGMPITEPLIDPKYTAEASSGLEFEAGPNKSFDFTVERYSGK